MTKQIICSHCGYVWQSETDLKFVSCPSCLKKTLSNKLKKEDKKNGSA
jgi:hypothetical protein